MYPFAIQPSPMPDRYAAVVILTSPDGPEVHTDAIERSLRDIGARGRVLFDMLLANGTRTRRFFARAFDGESFEQTGFEKAESGDAVRRLVAEFLKSNAERVDMTLLSPALRYVVRTGACI